MSEKREQFKLIGVDVAKDKLDIAFGHQEVVTISNNEAAFKKMLKKHLVTENSCFVMEASGGYEKKLVSFLLAKQIKVAVVNAKRVRDFANAMGAYAKNDVIDAEMIRQYAEAAHIRHHLQLRTPRSEVEQRIEALLKRRRQLIELQVVEKQHLSTVNDKAVIHSINISLKHFKREIAHIEKCIRTDINNDLELKEKMQRLLAVEGVGEICALTVIFQLPELGKVSHKEIASLVGVAPYSKDSGKKRGRRVIFGGRADVRSILYMATLSAIRHNSIIKAFYQRLLGKAKMKKVAITACMRKLLVILNAMLKNQTQWQPHFFNQA